MASDWPGSTINSKIYYDVKKFLDVMEGKVPAEKIAGKTRATSLIERKGLEIAKSALASSLRREMMKGM